MKKTLQIALPLALAGVLMWWVLKDTNWAETGRILSGANWPLVALSLLPAMLAHLFRAQRWRLLLEPVAPTPTLAEAFSAVMAGYLANLALPRFGELVRCTLLQRRRGIPTEVSLGTVIAERAFDVLMLLLITVLSVLLQGGPLIAFGQRLIAGKAGPDAADKGASGFIIYLLLFALAGVGLLWMLRGKLMQMPFYSKLLGLFAGLWAGISSALRLRNRGQFLLLTVLIWVSYYLSTWLGMEALPGLAGIGPLAGLMVLTIGSFGMVAPVQGGYGPYEFMVISALTGLYAKSQDLSAAAAILLHNGQTLLVVISGTICLLWLLAGKTKATETVAVVK